MFRFLMFLFILVASSTVFAETEGTAYCKGMATALKLPDAKVFETFVIMNEQGALNSYGNASEAYLRHIQQEAYMQGLGAGLGLGVLADKGSDYAFKLFMSKCYDNNYKLRNAGLNIEYSN